MFKRRALDLTDDLLLGEKSVHEAINKLTSTREKANILEVRWASGEDNPLIFSLFKRLAEIQWMYNEATKQMAEKHLELNKSFKRIFQEEKLLDESRKDLQGAAAKMNKLQKQVEGANKKGDHIKAQSVEAELNTQSTLCDHLTSSVETKTQKQELYKISQLKKALIYQAEGVITLAGRCQQLYASQMQLIDLLPDSPIENSGLKKDEVERQMTAVVSKVSELLDFHPPPNGGINLKSASVPAGPISENPEKFVRSKTTVGSHFPVISGFLKRHKSAENLNSVEPSSKIPHPQFQIGDRSNIAEVETVRPEVNYTQGMYCEIVIPERGGKGVPVVHNREGGDKVPMRRSQSGSSPSVNKQALREKHRSEIILDQHMESRILSGGFSGSRPLLDTDSETASIPYSSSEDLGLADDEPDPGYARLTILPSPSPSSQRSSPISPELEDSVGYARPADVVPLGFNPRDQLRKPRKGLATSPTIPERKKISAYETIEDIRKEKQKQQEKEKNDFDKRRVLSPKTSRVDMMEDDKGRPISCKDKEEPIYSMPFDTVTGVCPLKVTTDAPKNQMNVAPPVHKSGEKMARMYPMEKSVKSFHQTNLQVKDENQRQLSSSPETTNSSPNSRRDVAAKGRSASAKLSWKVPRSTGTLTPPLLSRKDSEESMTQSESQVVVPQFLIELNRKMKNKDSASSPRTELRGDIGRVASTGSIRTGPGTPAKVKKLRTGQATVINGSSLKPATKPKPIK